ncbi:MAG: AMP-forming long-chain acyl-CoA synthetase [Chloroflexi bacterium]|nr:MAG: AMP-forming long-chain acyl-CoA synthetase [Chloroflexota bacterium]
MIDIYPEDRLDLERYTLDHFFERIQAKYGPLTALATVGETPITYAELGERVANLQEVLRQAGIKKGSRVVILGPSSPNWGIAFLAVVTMGAVAVPVMDEFPDVDIEHIIQHAEVQATFTTESLFQSLSTPSLQNGQPVFNLKDFSVLSGSAPSTFWSDVQTRIKAGRDGHGGDPEISEDDLALILYTSGTTGHSKGVMLTHKNLVTNLMSGPYIVGTIDENSVMLGILPLAHAFGLITTFLAPMYCGATTYYLDKKPSPRILLRAMQEVRPTVMGAVPLIFEKIYQNQIMSTISRNKALSLATRIPGVKKGFYKLAGRKIKQAFGGRLDTVFIGGASINREVEVFLRTAGIPYTCGYGLSECSPIVSGVAPHEHRIGAVGRAIPGVSIKIADPDPATGVGEILVKGPNVMRGYYKNEAATQRVFTEDGWLITGDRGYLDEDGFLYIRGRSKNVIVGPSGENIYPEIIEDLLRESLYVEEALVYMADRQLVARIYPNYAYIQGLYPNKDESDLADDIARILENVRRETNERLPAFSQIQRVIEQRTPFLKTPTQKIKRAEYVPDYLSVK